MKDLADVKWTCPVCGKENTFHVHAHDVRLIPQTNADRIRAMTDEELAEFLSLVNDGDCLYAMGKTERCGNCGGEGCPCWLEWLQEEAEDAEE